MSWKSFVTAGLLCVLATPAFAAPQVRVVPGGTVANNHLNAAGNWVWRVEVAPDAALFPTGGPTPNQSPLAVELGFQVTGSSLVSVTAVNTAVWDKVNPGTAIPSFTGGTHASCGAAYNNNPCGLQSNTAAGTIFAAFGSTLLNNGNFQPLLEIVTTGPVSPSALSTTVGVLGAYGGEGLVAQATGYDSGAGKYIATAYDGFVNPAITRTATAGDVDLGGQVDGNDLLLFLQGFPTASGADWDNGDFDGNSNVDGNDLLLFLQNYPTASAPVGAGATITGTPVGSGSAAGSAVPEPASMALVGLALLGGLGLIRRR